MLFVLLALGAVVIAAIAIWIVWQRTKARRSAAPEVIYLGYDDQDNVSSMREAMLERLRRGDLDC